ncbi:ABC transporter family protein [Umezawaea tangerina]|uniref:ABC transporter family protein n=1 Tax=Umezawaea tangerina TaxID=84725 RepID=A0A2T0TFZ7_9PSEU|nr:ABC transporter family protein [Umezawaea tangerina]
MRGVDLVVEAGERVALTGTNGSGKTTLVRAVLGLHAVRAGVVEPQQPPHRRARGQ